jgi:hypothetical protein
VSSTRLLAAAFALCAIAAAGCGLGPGKDEGDVNLTVTRDYGRRVMLQKTDSIRESDSVIRLLDRNADISTRYGGGFVQSIDGLSGSANGGRSSDWFFYVNGVESPIGSAQYDPSGGDRVWWDYRDWTAAMRVPAVVGSWPEPFVHGFQGHRWATTLNCAGERAPCDIVGRRLAGAGVDAASTTGVGGGSQRRDTIEVLVGTWDQVRTDPTAALLASGPDRSGVFARFIGQGRPLLEIDNLRGQSVGATGAGTSLVAALRPDDGPPLWVVTGTDEKGVVKAAKHLGPGLRNKYAVAAAPGPVTIPVPVP